MKEREGDSPLSNFVFLGWGRRHVLILQRSKSSLSRGSRPPLCFTRFSGSGSPGFHSCLISHPGSLLGNSVAQGLQGHPPPTLYFETRSKSKNAPLTALYLPSPTCLPADTTPYPAPSQESRPRASAAPTDRTWGWTLLKSGVEPAWGNTAVGPLRFGMHTGEQWGSLTWHRESRILGPSLRWCNWGAGGSQTDQVQLLSADKIQRQRDERW